MLKDDSLDFKVGAPTKWCGVAKTDNNNKKIFDDLVFKIFFAICVDELLLVRFGSLVLGLPVVFNAHILK